jgi:hypothetical protein
VLAPHLRSRSHVVTPASPLARFDSSRLESHWGLPPQDVDSALTLLPPRHAMRRRMGVGGKHVGNKRTVAGVKANAEQRAANLRAIVDDLRSQGFTSVRAIAVQLNERGILTPRGGTWHPTSAARLLSRLQAAN